VALDRCARRDGPAGEGNPARNTEMIMSEKSHVSLEQRVCVICGATFDTNAILIDRRLQPSLECRTITGHGLCPSHQQMFDDGWVALIEIDAARSGNPSQGAKVKPGQAHRTGRVAFLKRETCAVIFNVPIEPTCPYVWADPPLLDLLEARTKEKALHTP
jgi:hypothetical protein